jgi:hypothetical protein
MYILTVTNKKNEGAYAITNKYGERVLYLFEEEDDAERYLGMLEELNYPEMEVTEVNQEAAILACERMSYQYVIITPEDIVIPPDYGKIYKSKI